MNGWKALCEEYSMHNEGLIEQLKERGERISELNKRVEELEEHKKLALELEEAYQLTKDLNQRYKKALELVEDELEYAKTTGNDEVRDMYIKNSIRFINEALEES